LDFLHFRALAWFFLQSFEAAMNILHQKSNWLSIEGEC
jgi:hypothetical protein